MEAIKNFYGRLIDLIGFIVGHTSGHFTDIPPAQRILEKIIKNLQDNLT